MAWLDAPTRLLDEGRPTAALEAMLDDWRTKRVPALADVIDLLSQAITKVLALPDGHTRRALQTAWLDLANLKRPVDVGRLVKTFPAPPWTNVAARVERLALLDDPRVAMAFAAFFQALPTAGGLGSRWTLLLDTIQRIGDVRVRGALEARLGQLDPRVTMGDVYSHARRVLAALPADPTTTDDLNRVAALEQQVREVLRRPLPGTSELLTDTLRTSAATSEAKLLELVYATPEDDEARLVYGDWLQERGDPRAELLTLQLKPHPLQKDLARAKQLVREFGRQWLGPLEPAIQRRTERFERGFPSAGAVAFPTQTLLDELTGHPAWNTFTELAGTSAPFLVGTELRGLERLSLSGEDVLQPLARREWPLRRVRALSLRWMSAFAVSALNDLAAPALTHLEVALNQGERERLPGALLGVERTLARLTSLRVADLRQPATVARLLALPNLKRLELTFPPAVFHRVPKGGWVLEVSTGDARLPKAASFVELLPLVSGIIEPGPAWGTKQVEVRVELQALVARSGLPWVVLE